MPSTKINAKSLFLKERIPTSQFFDIDDICDHKTDLPHMLPSPKEFEEKVSKLGISNEHHVCIYDQIGLYSAARCWWMFKVFGHENVSILDGGLPMWKKNKFELESGDVQTPTPTQYKAHYNPHLVKNMKEMLENLKTNYCAAIDARSADRFHGKVDEPRPGLKRGHIPGAMNVPFNSLLNEDQTVKSNDEIKEIFKKAGFEIGKDKRPIIFYCGSGVTGNQKNALETIANDRTACVDLFAMSLLGLKDLHLYDGSWSEYGKLEYKNPVDK